MRLYRAVSNLELEDIHDRQGELRDSPHRSGKGFFFERKDAVAFGLQARAYDPTSYFLICIEAPDDVVRRGRPHVAACEGPGVYLREEDLALLSGPLEETVID